MSAIHLLCQPSILLVSLLLSLLHFFPSSLLYLYLPFHPSFLMSFLPPFIPSLPSFLPSFLPSLSSFLPLHFYFPPLTVGHAYAKALHYRELEFQTSPAVCFESLININKKLDQYDAAIGILKVVGQMQKKHPELVRLFLIVFYFSLILCNNYR